MFVKPALAAATIALLAFAGCSSPAPSAGSPSAGQSAPASAPAAGSEVSVDDFLAKVSAGMASMKTYHVEMTVSGAGEGKLTTTGDIDAGVTPPNQHLTMTIAGKPVEMIVVGGDYFVKGMMGDGWVKMPAGAASSMSGSSGDQMSVLTNNKDAFEKIVLVGSEDVSGTPADHYRVTMNLEKIGGSMASASAAKTMTYDAWLDSEGRMLKAVTEMGKITTEATMSKFNEPVTIKAPTEFTEMPS